ncbi:MAG: RIO1 family regulatory kinase/ATPase [Patescibacteria group bacterium]|nr:hypothetical protein [Patescibacteria group bacterium]
MDKLLSAAIEQFTKKGINLELVRALTSGKEARVYIVSWEEKPYALKVYKEYATRAFKRNEEYLAGKYVRRPSERKAMMKRSKLGKELIHRLWIKREFYLLKKLYDAGADVPEPVSMTRNAILMEYIGNDNSPAQLLKSLGANKAGAARIYKKILKNVDIFYKNGIVHGDLSEFNILYSSGKIYIIDFPQAADIRNNPNADKLLKRDLENIEKWYNKYR